MVQGLGFSVSRFRGRTRDSHSNRILAGFWGKIPPRIHGINPSPFSHQSYLSGENFRGEALRKDSLSVDSDGGGIPSGGGASTNVGVTLPGSGAVPSGMMGSGGGRPVRGGDVDKSSGRF